MKSKAIGVLLSGGLDSAALMGHYLEKGYRVWPVYVKCGLPWEQAELYWIQRFLKTCSIKQCRPLRVLQLNLEQAYQKNWSVTGRTPGSLSSDQSVYLPARNLLLIIKSLLALSTSDVTTLALATLKGNPFPDAKKSYFKSLEVLLGKSFGCRVHIRTPFARMNKTQIINAYHVWPLHLTFSCINPDGIRHCGRCNKCAERKRAFKEARVKDLTKYVF